MSSGLMTGRAPSPAIALAVVALVAATVGTAVAGPSASTSAITKKKVAKIAAKVANQEIDKRAPGLSVAHADTANTADSANTAGSANTAESANTATTASTALNAEQLDGAEFCRTNGVVTEDDDDPNQTLCTRGPLSISTFCTASAATTSAVLRLVTTTAGTFARTPSATVESTAGAEIIVIVSVADSTGGDPAISTGPGDFSGGVPGTNNQLNGVATVRANATATDEGTCDFTLGAID
jgi:hypothetical protein